MALARLIHICREISFRIGLQGVRAPLRPDPLAGPANYLNTGVDWDALGALWGSSGVLEWTQQKSFGVLWEPYGDRLGCSNGPTRVETVGPPLVAHWGSTGAPWEAIGG